MPPFFLITYLIDGFGVRFSFLFHTILSTLACTILKDTDSVPAFYNNLMVCKGTF